MKITKLSQEGMVKVTQYQQLAQDMAYFFRMRRARGVPLDELVSEANYALTLAAVGYDESMLMSFRYYAMAAIKNRLINFHIAWGRKQRVALMDHVHLELNQEQDSQGEDEHDPLKESERCRLLLRLLPERLQLVLTRHYIDGLTHDQIAAEMGISPTRVRQLLERGLSQARLLWTRDVEAN